MRTFGSRRGFTLIELMIVVAAIAILAAIAFPSYTAYAKRSKIAAALGELGTVRVKLEQYYQDNRNYGSTATGCAVAMPSSTGFTFSCSWGPGATSQSFVVTASGLNGYVYTVNEADQQKTVSFDGATVNAACWLRQAGQAC